MFAKLSDQLILCKNIFLRLSVRKIYVHNLMYNLFTCIFLLNCYAYIYIFFFYAFILFFFIFLYYKFLAAEITHRLLYTHKNFED